MSSLGKRVVSPRRSSKFLETLIPLISFNESEKKRGYTHSRAHAIDSELWIILLDLSTLYFGQSLDWRITGILCQSQWDGVQSRGESSHGILFNGWNLVRGRMKKAREGFIRER